MHAGVGVLVLVWGTTWAAIRVQLEGIPPFTGIALRFAIASLLLLLIARLLRVPFQFDRRIRLLWAIETVFGFGLAYGLVYWAEQWVPSGLTAVLFSTFPLFVAVFAHFWLADERLRVGASLGILIGFGGVVVIFSEDLDALAGPGVAGAALVMLGSPLAAAVGHVLVRKWGRAIHPLNLTAVPMGLTSLVMAGVALAFEGGRPTVFDARSVGALLYLAIPGSILTFTLYYWLLARMPATQLSLITYGIPVVAIGVGAVLFSEPLTLRTALGTALVIGGVALAGRRRGPGAGATAAASGTPGAPGGERSATPAPTTPRPTIDRRVNNG